MNTKKFWDNAAKHGLFLGLVMGGAKVLEQSLILTGDVTYISLTTLVWLLSAVIYVSVLYKATKKQSMLNSKEEGYSFHDGFMYVIVISILTAIPVTCIYYVYINSIVGYDNYIDGIISSLSGVISQSGVTNELADLYDSMFDGFRNTPKPTIMGSLFGSILNYMLSGSIIGLIVAKIASRKPEIFDNKENIDE